MKLFQSAELPFSKTQKSTPKVAIVAALTLLLLTVIPICYPLLGYPTHLLNPTPSRTYSQLNPLNVSIEENQYCDIFTGEWVPDRNAPYYTNKTCWAIHEHQNCIKYGKPDTGYMKWRWKPDGCDLPAFNPAQFLEIVRDKSLAFVGDSVGRNQMQSMICLLSRVEYPIDVSYTADEHFKRWRYTTYNFTLAFFWTPHLVRSKESDPNGPTATGLFGLYLDEPDPEWATQIQEFDYVVLSAGHWFFRPQVFYQNHQIIGCHYCLLPNITDLTMYYGYRQAFRTAFKTINSLKNYKGITFLRTFAPSHFENGMWNQGGNCLRTRPFRSNETSLEGASLELYMIQLEEYRAAEEEGRKRGLRYRLLPSLLFFGIRWYRKLAHLRRCSNERSLTNLPIRTNGLGTSTDFSVSLSSSVAIQGAEFTHRNGQHSWWNHHIKDRFASASGIPRYAYKDIQKATHNFTTIVGQGSFGPVYKATMPTGGVAAVKVLASNSHQGEKEFQTEVSLLGRLHHRNLVNLIGYCVDKGQYMLIYEFMSNGSLANLLYSEEARVLSWEERLQIALDISHGIEYLHEGAVPPVIHRDLKSANILLDHSMTAKVADFGLSKEEVFDGRNSGLKGTYGYIDPAYISTNKFTMKSDIYSFGIIIFELITAIHPHQNLMEYVNLAGMSPDGVDEILDKKLGGECNIMEVRKLANIGHICLHKLPRKRPSIGEVTQAILKIKQRRLTKEDTMSFNGREFLRVASVIEDQQVELSKLTGIKQEA